MKRFTANFTYAALAGIVTITSVASGASFFTEDFSGPGLPGPNLEQVQAPPGTAADFTGEKATFAGAGDDGRSYLRTLDTDYNTINFAAEVTITVADTGAGGGPSGFFGIGPANRGDFAEPDNSPTVYIRLQPDGFQTGSTTVVEDELDNPQTVIGMAGDGTHRVRMVWNAASEQVTFSVDEDYAGGPFTADVVAGGFSSALGLDATNSNIYFGGAEGVMFDDLSVTVPEPMTLGMVAAGLLCCAIGRRRRRPTS